MSTPMLFANGTLSAGRAARPGRTQVRQMIVGLLALPLTAVPFVGYANLTPEGRLVRDRAMVALSPPSLPKLSRPQLQAAAAAAPRYEGAVMALAYHGIGSASDSEGGFVVSAKRFGEHLATLKAAGMHTVTAAQVAAAFTGGPQLPPNAVMLSFDDGRADAMMFADPLLEQADMSATMFLIANAASKPGIYYASWDKIEAYARSGRWDIQSHTAASHRDQKAAGGGSLPALTSLAPSESLDDYRSRVREDLDDAGAAIQAHVGQRPVAFAYPFGAYGGDRSNDPQIATVLREEVARHYAVAFQQDDQETVPLVTPGQDLLRLRRLEVENWSGIDLLKRIDEARISAGLGDGLPVPLPEGAAPPVPGDETPAGATTETTTPSTSRTGAPPAGASPRDPASDLAIPGLPPVTLPQVSAVVPPVTVTPPSVTLPPVSVPPVTLRPPVTLPPTTAPPPTSPPTTSCVRIGKSGKCRVA